jgi:hypothetical protein
VPRHGEFAAELPLSRRSSDNGFQVSSAMSGVSRDRVRVGENLDVRPELAHSTNRLKQKNTLVLCSVATVHAVGGRPSNAARIGLGFFVSPPQGGPT